MNETENIKEILEEAKRTGQKLKSFKVSWRIYEIKTPNYSNGYVGVSNTVEVVKPEIEIIYE